MVASALQKALSKERTVWGSRMDTKGPNEPLCPHPRPRQVRSAVRKKWHRWQDHHALQVPVARAMSIPTSPTRVSFHSIKQTVAM